MFVRPVILELDDFMALTFADGVGLVGVFFIVATYFLSQIG
ncbi:MAG: hypothetical protein AAFQ96_06200 [Pseudomonadota bacterium]